MKVYLLQHSYEYEIYEDIKPGETKIIGRFILISSCLL